MRQFRDDDTSIWQTRYGDKSAGSKSFGTETIDSGDGAYYSRVQNGATVGNNTASLPDLSDGSYNLPCVVIIMQDNVTIPQDNWEFNVLVSVSGGVGTFLYPFENDYYLPANGRKSQVVTANPFSDIELTGTLSCPAWDGDKYGIGFLMGGDLIEGVGKLNAVGKGFRGANQGTGYVGEGTKLNYGNYYPATNGNGGQGGGPGTDAGHVEGGNGGGAGNRTNGQNGNARNTGAGGQGGEAVSTQDGRTIYMGGGGSTGGTPFGGGSWNNAPAGSGIWITVAREQTFADVDIQGQNGPGSATVAGDGASAPGVFLAKGQTIALSGTINDSTGVGGTCTGSFGGKGGDSGEGVVHQDYAYSAMAGEDSTLHEILSDVWAHEGVFSATREMPYPVHARYFIQQKQRRNTSKQGSQYAGIQTQTVRKSLTLEYDIRAYVSNSLTLLYNILGVNAQSLWEPKEPSKAFWGIPDLTDPTFWPDPVVEEEVESDVSLLVTEDGDFIVTEAGEFIVAE